MRLPVTLQAAPQLPRNPWQSRVLLVVDEDPSTVNAVARVARDLGMTPRVAQTAESALAIAGDEAPSVLVTALDLGGQADGLSMARTVRERFGAAVILTGATLPSSQFAAVATFAPDAFLCKPLRPEQVDATIRLTVKGAAIGRTAGGARQPDPDLARALRQIAAVVHGTGVNCVGPSPAPNVATLAALRPREQEVVRLLFEHCRVPAIAVRMGISPQTVRNHLKHIFSRLGVHSQQELIARLRAGAGAVAEVERIAHVP